MVFESFVAPKREIMTIFDISKWYKTEAYQKYLLFIKKLNKSVKGISTTSDRIVVDSISKKLIGVLDTLETYIDEYPPVDMGSQRFGNRAYKDWYARMSNEIENLIKPILPNEIQGALLEIVPYLLDAFGNSTRIDYGSGHEACFLIFLFCLYELEVFHSPENDKSVVLRIFRRYLKLVRTLQLTYRMEPAGSRGVYAIDDFQFAPFIFGSSQLIDNGARLVPDYYLRQDMVEQYKDDNLFFEAVQFINENKTGPFFEHSNQLYNISAVQCWDKLNDGMLKMYEGEVLKKFPVVQHFLFGRIFSFKERKSSEMDVPENLSGLEKLAQNRIPINLSAIPE